MGQPLATTSQLLLNRWALNACTYTKISWPTVTTTTSAAATKIWIGTGQAFRMIHGESMSTQSSSILATKYNHQPAIIPTPPPPLVRYVQTSVMSMNNRQDSGSTGGEAGGSSSQEWKTLLLSKPSKYVAHVELNRPKVKNAFGLDSANELINILDALDDDPTVRCVLLSGNGPDFTSGVDLKSFMSVYGQLQETDDVGRKAKLLRNIIAKFQTPFKRMDLFTKPLLCIQHGLCYGLGMELAACSDIRYCSADTKYSIREVLIGIAADVGSLQKMPALVNNQSLLRELIYTGRDVDANEALHLGFVSRVCSSKEEALSEAMKTASAIAKRSPVAVQGSKQNLRFSSDKSFDVGLDYNAIWNMCMMQSGDVVKAIETVLSRSGDDADFENF